MCVDVPEISETKYSTHQNFENDDSVLYSESVLGAM